MKKVAATAILLTCTTTAYAQDTPRKAYELLVGCAIVYAEQHPSPRLTASELADAAVASCDMYASMVHERALRTLDESIAPDIRNTLSAAEIQRRVRETAEAIRADAIKKARLEVLQAIAERK